MKIVVLGAGAMGSLFGSYLSEKNEVYLIDVNTSLLDQISKSGVLVKEKDDSEKVYWPKVCFNPASLGKVDLIVAFVKSMYTVEALDSVKPLIGANTYLLTFQNGAGHERKLLKFADPDHVLIGTTQHNSSVLGLARIFHGGEGPCLIGSVGSGNAKEIEAIACALTESNLHCSISENIKKQIWNKLFTNTAASSLAGLFQVPLGCIYTDENARWLMRKLVFEAVEVANAQGFEFDYEEAAKGVEDVLISSKNGFTSIYSDLKNHRKTEVDAISGYVIASANELGVPVPYHDMLVKAIHVMEGKYMRV